MPNDIPSTLRCLPMLKGFPVHVSEAKTLLMLARHKQCLSLCIQQKLGLTQLLDGVCTTRPLLEQGMLVVQVMEVCMALPRMPGIYRPCYPAQ